MLVLTTKNIEVEEKIQIQNENGDILVDFTMQITPNEMQKIKNMLFDENYKLSKETNEDILLEKAYDMQARFEKIIFKDELENIKEKCGEYKFNELIDELYSFFMNIFIEKRSKQINTLNTNLQKITKH